MGAKGTKEAHKGRQQLLSQDSPEELTLSRKSWKEQKLSAQRGNTAPGELSLGTLVCQQEPRDLPT